jgi:hypothetical protein
MRRRCFDFFPRIKNLCLAQMRLLISALLSIATFALVWVIGVNGDGSYTTHIGSRVPPSGLGCIQTGEIKTDEGKSLNVYSCPA